MVARRDARLLLAAALAALLAGSGALGQLQVDFGQVCAAPPPPPPPRPRRTAALAQPSEGGGRIPARLGGRGGEARAKPGPRARTSPEAPPPQRIPPPVTPEAGRSRRTPLALLPAWRGSGGGRARPAAGGRAGGMPCSLLPGVPREESWGLIPAPAAPAAPDRPDRPLPWGPSRSRTESDLGRAGEGWARRTRVATPCQPRSPFGHPLPSATHKPALAGRSIAPAPGG